MTKNPDLQLLTITDVCALLNCSRQTVYRRVLAGELRCTRIGRRSPRFTRKAVDAFIKRSGR